MLEWVNRKIDSILSDIQFRSLDTVSALELSKLGVPYLPWTRSAMRPSAVATIINDIIINDRRLILELGSGISTFYICKIIEHKPIRKTTFISIDENKKWIEFMKSELVMCGLDRFVNITHAPLTECNKSIDKSKWYSVDAVLENIYNKNIDLLVVDGPTAYQENRKLSRYPAVPILKSLFSDNFAIILDDCNRPGEREIARLWGDILNIDFRINIRSTNIGHAMRGEGFFSGL